MATTIYFDFETGGIEDSAPNIQLAAIAVNSEWEEIDSIEIKIQFDEAEANPEALKINHYDPEIWKERALPPAIAVARFDEFICRHRSIEMVSKRTGQPYSVARLAGHNALTFDYPRLKRMYGTRFVPAHPQVLDTLQLALWHFQGRSSQPENFRLESLAKFFGFKFDSAHDALADVRASAQLAQIITERGLESEAA